MILPIVAYGDPVLKKKAVNVEKQHLKLKELIRDMWETMYAAYGVGLAAPQIGESLRLFIVDGSPFAQDKSLDHVEQQELKAFKKVFINPEIISYSGLNESFNEGCLSIPDVREDVSRLSTIEIVYYNEKFEKVEEVWKSDSYFKDERSIIAHSVLVCVSVFLFGACVIRTIKNFNSFFGDLD